MARSSRTRGTSTSRSISSPWQTSPCGLAGYASSWTSTRWPTDVHLHLLGEGRLVNLTAAEGHPAAVMDMSFADQALAVEWVVTQPCRPCGAEVYPVPVEIDKEVARLKLHAMGVEIDALTAEQDSYLHSWQQGT